MVIVFPGASRFDGYRIDSLKLCITNYSALALHAYYSALTLCAHMDIMWHTLYHFAFVPRPAELMGLTQPPFTDLATPCNILWPVEPIHSALMVAVVINEELLDTANLHWPKKVSKRVFFTFDECMGS
jgi:hypothetical protein